MSNVFTTFCDIQCPISAPKSSGATTKEHDVDVSVEHATEPLFVTDGVVAASSLTLTPTVRPHLIIFHINTHIKRKPTEACHYSDRSRH